MAIAAVPARSGALLLCALSLSLLALLPGPARAERVGSIILPDSIPDLLDQTPPIEELADPVPLPGVYGGRGHKPLGVTLDNYQLTAEQIQAAQGTGISLVRLPIPMEAFLEEEDSDWAALDQVVSRLSRAGFEIVPVLDAMNAVPDFYQSFCSRIAARYSKTFRYYQLLDNINYKHGIDSREYADLISRARLTIRMADSDALIVSGGIRGADLTYLDMLELQRAMRNIDILAFNLYPPKDGIEEIGDLRREHSLPYMAEAINWAAKRDKPVWVTAFGISSDLTWVGVDQPTQAALYCRGALFLGTLGVEHVFLAAIQDSDPNYQSPARCCGLLDTYGEPKPAYYALSSLNNTLRDAYHTEPVFRTLSLTYQQPSTSDYALYSSKAFERSDFDSDDDGLIEYMEYGDQLIELSGMLDSGPVGQLRVRGLPTYAYWVYSPDEHEYRLIYWISREQNFPTLVTVVCGHQSLLPFGDFISPVQRYGLLDDGVAMPAPRFAQNLLYLPFLGLDTMPSVICFKVNQQRVQSYLTQPPGSRVRIEADPGGLRPAGDRAPAPGPQRGLRPEGGKGGN
ncbi:hypothetical protein IT575_01405 [bacterium]|nr:hypothetical protein [bacterium]